MISYITRYTDLSSNRFLLHPPPMQNELLSSWLVRVALAHQTMPWSFMNMHFPEYKNIVFSRDVDIWAPDEFIEKLAWKSGLKSEDIFNMTLRSYEGYLLEKVRLNGQNIFISPIIPRKRCSLGYGQKYCPVCLREHVPYFKKEWRLSFYTVCIEHGCRMLDRCNNCGIPITFYKFKHEHGFTECYRCTQCLFKGHSHLIVMDEESARVKRLMKILEEGYALLNGRPVYSIAFFEVLHQIAKIVKHFAINDVEDTNGIAKAESIIVELRTGMQGLLSYPKICPSHLTQDMRNIWYFYYKMIESIY